MERETDRHVLTVLFSCLVCKIVCVVKLQCYPSTKEWRMSTKLKPFISLRQHWAGPKVTLHLCRNTTFPLLFPVFPLISKIQISHFGVLCSTDRPQSQGVMFNQLFADTGRIPQQPAPSCYTVDSSDTTS